MGPTARVTVGLDFLRGKEYREIFQLTKDREWKEDLLKRKS